MKKGDRIKVREFEYKGMEGTVIDVFQNKIITVKLDNFIIPVATMIENLDII